jgi:hypothetical protein
MGRAIVLAVVLAAMQAFSASASASRPIYRPTPAGTPVALVPGGAVWYDEGPIEFDRFGVGTVQLGWGGRYNPDVLQSSADAVAGVLGEGRFQGGLLGGRIRPMYQPVGVPAGECEVGWIPDAGDEPDFVLSGRKIISAATCVSADGNKLDAEAANGQPLFIHDVRGGEWRVWRWLHGGFEPPLAVEGSLVAVGEPPKVALRESESTARRYMRVSIVDSHTGAVLAHFRTPFGQLAFAAPDRLVVTVSESRRATAASRAREGFPAPTYRSFLYALDGRRLADLGTFDAIPRISNMHLLTTGSTLEVRSLPNGPSSPVIGFDGLQRTLRGIAFHWPALALEETTASALPAEQVNCRTGYYSESSPPFLQIIDIASPFAFEPAPPPSPLEAQDVLASKHCPIVAVNVAPRRP